MSKVLIIKTSLRTKSNSDILADKVFEGAKDAGHDVEIISLKDTTIGFCKEQEVYKFAKSLL
jgi:multimeric flavodoxin WrbA